LNKKELFKKIIEVIEAELDVAMHAAATAREDATNEESKPENEYDTRALEASYVASGQSKRVAELEEALYMFKHFDIKKFGPADLIGPSALVKVEHNGKVQNLLLMGMGGGVRVVIDGTMVQVVSPNSPLGQNLAGLKLGESFIIDVGERELEYEIVGLE
jgi:hypothetical protein